MTDNPFGQINDDMHTTSHHQGAADGHDSLTAAAPVGSRILPPSGPSPECGRGATQPAAPEPFSDAAAPAASLGATQARQTPAVTQTAPHLDGADLPLAAPSTLENWQRRVLRLLIEGCGDRRDTRYGVLSPVEIAAIESLI